MGIVGCPLAVADEPGSWEIRGGQLMADALLEAQGKPGSPLRLIFIGTLAPFAESPGHWWYDLIADGSQGSTYVQALQGDPERWDKWSEIRRVNPLANLPGADGAVLRAKLRERRAQAWRDTRLKARFLSYRLNRPTADESKVLLTAPELAGVLARPVPEREGVPVVGVDMGQSRSWSAAVACWPSGRIEARAVAPGLPDLASQERRDRVPSGTYQRLVDDGVLTVAAGRRAWWRTWYGRGACRAASATGRGRTSWSMPAWTPRGGRRAGSSSLRRTFELCAGWRSTATPARWRLRPSRAGWWP